MAVAAGDGKRRAATSGRRSKRLAGAQSAEVLLGNAGERRKKPSQETKGGDAAVKGGVGGASPLHPLTPSGWRWRGMRRGGGRWA